MKRLIVGLMLVGMALAQTPATKTEEKLPKIPDHYQTELQALVIQQQILSAHQKQLIEQYNADQVKLNGLNGKGVEMQNKILKEVGLDPTKYDVRANEQGYLEIEKTPAKQ